MKIYVCQRLGWKGKNGPFDILPLVVSNGDQPPEYFQYPNDLILEVNITHPQFEWFKDLGLKWYAVPAVSNMCFECGGLEFTAAPFNGWYMGTEIAARNFCDTGRYDIVQKVGEKMGLDTKTNASLWKDKVVIEVNVAVLHSFMLAGVTISDHHSAAESFMKHLKNEFRLRRGCPADWVWLVPPISGSLTPVFHQEFVNYRITPSYEYQDDPWNTYVWPEKRLSAGKNILNRRKFSFKEIGKAVKFSAKLMTKALAKRVKCRILYATETGKSQQYAMQLYDIFKHAFDVKVSCMDQYDITDLEHETLVLIVTSTFGNGDAPESGESFAEDLQEMVEGEPLNESWPSMTSMGQSIDSLHEVSGPLKNVKHSVFALGSRAYPNFCAFAHVVNNLFRNLASEEVLPLVEGDDLCGQDDSFKIWASHIYQTACESFCAGDLHTNKTVNALLTRQQSSWSPGTYRLQTCTGSDEGIVSRLSRYHSQKVVSCNLKSRRCLTSDLNHQTILVVLETEGISEVSYVPGDHMAIFPRNNKKMVDELLALIADLSDVPEGTFVVEMMQDKDMPGKEKWEVANMLPTCTIREAFTLFLDIASPPSPKFLTEMAHLAGDNFDKARLLEMANDRDIYDEWKFTIASTLVETLKQFPSVRIPATLLLTQLPKLQQRFYSISSSPQQCPGEIHLTVAVVRYQNKSGIHYGVCSSWLNNITDEDCVPCFIRAAPNFHMPKNKDEPIIMVGPGTGIAPFRSFWQQRRSDMSDGTCSSFGRSHLYFGCRNSKIDDIYGNETKDAKQDGIINEVYTALSREPNKEKVYVQNIISRNSQEVYELLTRENGHLYVCGDVSMAAGVQTVIENIFQKEGNMTCDSAKKHVRQMKSIKHYHEDIFGITLRTPEVTENKRILAKQLSLHSVSHSD